MSNNIATSVGDHGTERVVLTGLPRPQRSILAKLADQGPLKAYELLNLLKHDGIKAPMTVYRALDKLQAKGLVLKLEAENAFALNDGSVLADGDENLSEVLIVQLDRLNSRFDDLDRELRGGD